MKKLIIISGPSCVGKTPLFRCLKRLYPNLLAGIVPLVLYNSRAPRPSERDGIDYHFCSRRTIERMRSDQCFIVMNVRADLQALDIHELLRVLKRSDMLFEGNPFTGSILLTEPSLRAVNKTSIFISPLSRDEVVALRNSRGISIEKAVTLIMRQKLLRRARRQKGTLTAKDIRDIAIRARSAYKELAKAYMFDYVIPNHDGEDSEHWDLLGEPVGDARRTLLSVVAILKGRRPPVAEIWQPGLIR